MPRLNNQFGFQSYSLVPPAIKMLIAINVIVFVASALILPGLSFDGESLSNVFERTFALMPQGSEMFYPYWQLLSYQFLHGGLGHLFFNMLALWMFGSELEQIWGSSRFLVYYLLCGIGGGLLHLAIDAGAPTVGASGAIMGVLVGFGMTFPDRPVMMFPLFIPIPARIFVVIYALIDLYSGISSSMDGIAHFAHLGGAITGVLLLKFGERSGFLGSVTRLGDKIFSGSTKSSPGLRVVDAKYRDITPAAQTPTQHGMFHGGSFFFNGEYITEDTVNVILDKISATGYDSLDQREKDILLEISRRMS
ncbi:MAG: rhomboid family intramembrane serine protease [Candidatus Kapaibacterium sp.]|jgi:membrane associated rhomboid family serine protease